jgi:hypothetical protein
MPSVLLGSTAGRHCLSAAAGHVDYLDHGLQLLLLVAEVDRSRWRTGNVVAGWAGKLVVAPISPIGARHIKAL